MRCLAVAVALLAAACVSPRDYHVDLADDAAPPDAPIDAAPIDTPDGPGPHNEDLDEWDDLVDRCPTVYTEGAQNPDTDTDGDGLDDACDPQQGPANRIVFLATFKPGDPPWISEGGATWSIVDDALEMDQSAARTGAYSPVVVPGPIRVVATFEVFQLGVQPDISVFDEYDPTGAFGGGVGAECFVRKLTATTGELVTNPVRNGERVPTESQTTSVNAPVLGPSSITEISAEQASSPTGMNNSKRCRLGVTGSSATRSRSPFLSGRVRVGARDARVRVRSVIAYTLSL